MHTYLPQLVLGVANHSGHFLLLVNIEHKHERVRCRFTRGSHAHLQPDTRRTHESEVVVVGFN